MSTENLPTDEDWSYAAIAANDGSRAQKLANARSPQEMVVELRAAFEDAVATGRIRLGVDSLNNRFEVCRLILQFPIPRELYDWFFNGRTGYRAQYWVSTDCGEDFNRQVATALKSVLSSLCTWPAEARRIWVEIDEGTRVERDGGAHPLTKHFAEQSLDPDVSKVWICERQIQTDGTSPREIGFPLLADAQRSPIKLQIPRWADAVNPCTEEIGEGLRAPYPADEVGWIDLKGGFIGLDNVAVQSKPQSKRSRALHARGWT